MFVLNSLSNNQRLYHLRKLGVRMCGAIARGQVGQNTWWNDWSNFWNLLLNTAASQACCPICGYVGPFLQHALQPREICLRCGSRARHRVIHLALQRRLASWQPLRRNVLHLAPEQPLVKGLSTWSDLYVTADIEPGQAQIALDLRCASLASGSFDLVLASHVLEHIVEDRAALAEIYRVLHSSGIAVLIVPIVTDLTDEWGFADSARNDHARDCGLDYFDRYREAGFHVELVQTDDFADGDRFALASWRHGQRTIHWVAFCTKE
jgi:SAM-dependent methyltransferase